MSFWSRQIQSGRKKFIVKDLLFNLPDNYVIREDISEKNIIILEDKFYIFNFTPITFFIKGINLVTTGKINDNHYQVIHSKKFRYLFRVGFPVKLQGKMKDNKFFFPSFYDFRSGIVPIYKDLTTTNLTTLKELLNEIPEDSLKESLKKIHLPITLEDAQEGFNIAFANEIATTLHFLKQMQSPRISYENQLKYKLPFTLNESQEKCMHEIEEDFKQNHTTIRLIYGEVGSGKTVISFLAALKIAQSNKRVLFLAPTSILSEQVYRVYKNFLSINNSDLSVSLITSYKTSKTHDNIDLEFSDIIIGTHALLFRTFENVGLLIIDEQHRFGVEQRTLLIDRYKCDLIMMTATPIPRTLAMIGKKYIEVSYLSNRISNNTVKTFICEMYDREKLLQEFLAISKYEKIIWLQNSIVLAEELYKELSKNFQNIFLIHSKIKDKDKILSDFDSSNGLLISTTVIEVGIDLDIKYIIIENADEFGLSQLHQLRGRVGRKTRDGICVLLGKDLEKLHQFKEAISGFEVSKIDLTRRGEGTLQGIKQSGFYSFHFLHSISPEGKIIDRDLLSTDLDLANNFLSKNINLNHDLFNFDGKIYI